jgi:hypothetical protein
MDDVYRTNALIPDQPLRYSWTPHMNHRLSPEVAVAMPLWFDHYLKGGPALPETPRSRLVLDTADHIPLLKLTPDTRTLPVARVDIYYSVDPDPRSRFWRSAEVVQEGDTFSAKLPLHTLNLPLFAFANVHYTLPRAESLPHMSGITEVCLSSLMHSANAAELQAAGGRGADAPTLLIDDFARGWHDWYRLNADNKSHWQNWTRKVTDPKWRGLDGASLKVTLTMPEANHVTFVLIENEWRAYRGPRKAFVCEREIEARAEAQSVSLTVADFKDANGGSPGDWRQTDQLGICASYERREPNPWRGEMPQFHRIEWESAPVR